MKKHLFQATKTDTLEDIIFKGRNMIVENRLRVNHLVLKPYKKSCEVKKSPEVEVEAMFKIPYNDKIKLMGETY